MTNLLNQEKKSFLAQLMKEGIKVTKKLPEGEHKVILNGVHANLADDTVTIKLELEGQEYEHIMLCNTEKRMNSVIISLKQIGEQLELSGNLSFEDFDKEKGKEITIWVFKLPGKASVYYNYSEPNWEKLGFSDPTQDQVAATSEIDGKDF